MLLRFIVATTLGLAPVLAAGTDTYDSAAIQTIMLPMRDGTRLATDIYRPARAGEPVDGKFPVLVTRGPYNKSGEKSKGLFFARHGYVWVAQDCRGFFASEGRPTPFLREGDDGYDTIEWAAAQPWSNGKVATTGASYLAMNQFAAAIEAPPHLLAIYAAVGGADFYADSAWRGGIPSLSWPVWLLNSTGQREVALKPDAWLALPREKRADTFANFPAQQQAYWDFYRHSDFDSYWKQEGFWPAGYYDRMKDVPMLLLSGWYDSFCDANLRNFRALSQGQHTVKKLVIGPWPHGYGKGECGDAVFGADGELDEHSLQLDWFDHWLKGSALKVVDPAPLRYYRIGAADERTSGGKFRPGGEWRTASTWPLPDTQPALYYLRSGGKLDPTRPRRELPSSFVHDPANPVPTIGGRQGNACIQDQRPLEKRADVLSFVSAPLTAPLDLTGTPRAGFWVESDAPQADFILRVADIFPDGYAAILSEGQVRTHGAGEVAIPLTAISKLIGPGHRIGLFVMSSSFPKLEPLPAKSRNTIYHDEKRSSWLELPIVPATRK
jgi:putative CocE/NonD family hydrolase